MDKVPHEIGHYLHIRHTFGPTPRSLDEACEIIRSFVDVQGHPKENGTDVFDGDLNDHWYEEIVGGLLEHSIADTLPDPGPTIFQNSNIDECNVNVLKIFVDLKDDPQHPYYLTPEFNIMSYWGPCIDAQNHIRAHNRISKGQADIIRYDALEKGNRNHLIAPRVLYDAIWEPSNPGQTRVLGWEQNDFAVRFDKELASNRHVVLMQAYMAANGQLAWDGVWENGDTGQTRAIRWAQNDFAKRFDDEIAKGKHVVLMQAYMAANGQLAWDGVWENGDTGQTRAIGWAQNDFIKRFDDEIAKGKHVVLMQAYMAANGRLAWDGVWEPGDTGQTRALGLDLGDFTVRLDSQLANNKKIVRMQAYLRR